MHRVRTVLGDIRADSVGGALTGANLENVKVRQAPEWLCKAWSEKTMAMTLGATILFRPEVNSDWSDSQIGLLVAHELTHVRQFRRLGPAAFAIRYLSDYLRSRKAGLNHFDAYEAIELEREARDAAQIYRNGAQPD